MHDNDTVINLRSVYRTYRLYDQKIDRLKEALDPFKNSYHRDFIALNNVTLDVKKGEVLGVVGRNGSGKSTLLKVISGILPPSSGEMRVDGHVVPLIELGAGFNPDFTGLENIYFYNSIHGFSKEETDSMLDDILDFAEIGDFISQPLKIYSSGMRARLAFAVSINIKPDILILDEVLSVGDEMFRRKCFSKMEEFFKGGKTVLYVSHSSNSINELCTRCIWLNEGELILDGPPKLVTAMYNRLSHTRPEEIPGLLEEIRALNQDEELKAGIYEDINSKKKREPDENYVPDIQKDAADEAKPALLRDLIRIKAHYIPDMLPKSTLIERHFNVDVSDVKVTTLQGEQVNVILSGEEYQCHYKVKFNEELGDVFFRVVFKDEKGAFLAGMNTRKAKMIISRTTPGEAYWLTWKFKCNFLGGYYFVGISVLRLTDEGPTIITGVTDALVFQVVNPADIQQGGFVHMDIQPAIRQI
jgi:lipopolysaccharide transport system ATP-binding protein